MRTLNERELQLIAGGDDGESNAKQLDGVHVSASAADYLQCAGAVGVVFLSEGTAAAFAGMSAAGACIPVAKVAAAPAGQAIGRGLRSTSVYQDGMACTASHGWSNGRGGPCNQ